MRRRIGPVLFTGKPGIEKDIFYIKFIHGQGTVDLHPAQGYFR